MYLFHNHNMNRNLIIERLKSAEAALRARGVDHAALFGSVARGEAGPASDIVIMMEIAPDAELDMFAYTGIVHMIKDMFRHEYDNVAEDRVWRTVQVALLPLLDIVSQVIEADHAT